MSTSNVLLDIVPVQAGREDAIAFLTLHRPEVSNAFNAAMIEEFLQHFEWLRTKGRHVRAVVLRGEGKHFSGGADLEWMKSASTLGYNANVKDAEKLSRPFGELYALPIPTIGVVQGAAFGGAVGLTACCDWAIAVEGAKFCLSEVKVGLVAAVILPYLSVKMVPGELRRLVMTAEIFDGAYAMRAGLVQKVCAAADVDRVLREELKLVLSGEPTIQRTFKENHRRMLEGQSDWWAYQRSLGIETIARARVSATGQAGIKAFLEKRAPEWVVPLPEGWQWK